MIVTMFDEAQADLEQAFDHYESELPGLGIEMLDEFRRGVDRIIEHPAGWQPLDATYRRYRLHRFPYGIIYRVAAADDQIVVVAFMHMAQRPGSWRRETPSRPTAPPVFVFDNAFSYLRLGYAYPFGFAPPMVSV